MKITKNKAKLIINSLLLGVFCLLPSNAKAITETQDITPIFNIAIGAGQCIANPYVFAIDNAECLSAVAEAAYYCCSADENQTLDVFKCHAATMVAVLTCSNTNLAPPTYGEENSSTMP